MGHQSDSGLRQFAALIYITSLDGITLKQMAQNPLFADNNVNYHVLLKWCSRDNWKAQRLAYFAKIREQIEQKVGDKLVEERIKTLNTISNLVNKAIEGLERNMKNVKSYEGLLASTMKAIELREGLMDKIMDTIDPKSLETQKNPIQQTTNLSREELIKMTQTVLSHRREQKRKAKELEEKEEKPRLQIVRQPIRG